MPIGPYQNFTTPWYEQDQAQDQAPPNHYVNGDPNSGEYEARQGGPTFDRFGWGGRGNDIDPNTGQEIPGTNGLDRDVARYQAMGQAPINTSGPQINQSQSNQSRGLVMGGLGALAQRANGGGPHVAEQAGLVNAQHSAGSLEGMAATTRGGIANRLQAAHLARRAGAQVVGQQYGANAAVRAGEQADAREMLAGASGALRGQDIGLAAEQAKLNQQQHGLNDQREGFYEDRAHNAQVDTLGAKLGRSAEEQAASASMNQIQQQGAAQREAAIQQNIATGTSAAAGGVSAYMKTHPEETGSDERMKKVHDLQDVELKGQLGWSAGTDGKGRNTTYSPIESKQNVRDMYETQLAAEDEPAFQAWKQKYAAKDSGADYDYRGAFRAGLAPDAKGHWSDRFKKPNHPTFSNESQYAPAGNPGRWEGERFVPPAKTRVRERTKSMLVRDNPYDAANTYDRSAFRREGDPAPPDENTARLHAGIEKVLGQDRLVREDPYSQQRFGARRDMLENPNAYDKGVAGAPKGYARTAPFPSTVAPEADERFGTGQSPTEAEDAAFEVEKERVTRKDKYGNPVRKDKLPPKPTDDRYSMYMAAVEPMYIGDKRAHADAIKEQAKTPEQKATEQAARDAARAAAQKAADEKRIAEAQKLAQQRAAMTPEELRTRGYTRAAEERQAELDSAPYVPPEADPRADITFSPKESKQRVIDLDWDGPSQPPHVDYTDPQLDFHRDTPKEQKAVADKYFGQVSKDADAMIAGLKRGAKDAGEEHVDADTHEAPDLSHAAQAQEEHAKDSPLASAMRAMHPYAYEYKPGFREAEGQTPGEENIGPMAQELAKDPKASTVLTTDPKTGLYAIDVKKGLKLSMGALADLQRQVDELKSKKKRVA